mmetsp:Transcript_39126/g.100204  ORF Transcript_39126/g.100204 Transcript_39126/m.100204 type:complete len:98 (-) Transcript_39126:307-600(-)
MGQLIWKLSPQLMPPLDLAALSLERYEIWFPVYLVPTTTVFYFSCLFLANVKGLSRTLRFFQHPNTPTPPSSTYYDRVMMHCVELGISSNSHYADSQ